MRPTSDHGTRAARIHARTLILKESLLLLARNNVERVNALKITDEGQQRRRIIDICKTRSVMTTLRHLVANSTLHVWRKAATFRGACLLGCKYSSHTLSP